MSRRALGQAKRLNDLSFPDHGVNASDCPPRVAQRVRVRQLARRFLKSQIHQRALLLEQLAVKLGVIQFSYF